ncbi:MAG TPA: type II toxin-antitoxin system RelE/ParE family toxin [Thermomicrobiales bacterium]
MKSSRRLRLSPEARADDRDIRRYTTQRRGARQRDLYYARLNQGMHALLDYPERGRSRDDLYAGCRGLPVEQHVVFYYLTDGEVVIDRVLHGSQDPTGKVGP